MIIQINKYKKAFCTVSLLISAGLITGCSSTPRGLQHVPVKPGAVQDAAQTPDELSFAATAGKLAVGSTGVLQTTPLGKMAQTSAQSTYMNALGEECKKILVKSKDAELRCGVCLGKDGVWRYVPNVQ